MLRNCILECGAEVSRHGDKPSFAIDGSESRARGHELCPVVGIFDRIMKPDASRSRFGENGRNANPVLVFRGGVVTQARVNYGKLDSLPLQVGIRRPKFSNQVRPSHFAPYEIVRMIDDLHLVGFRVANEELDFTGDWRRADGGHGAKDKDSPRLWTTPHSTTIRQC